jgi:hypothetical protein
MQLVEGRPSTLDVLLEGEREVGALLELASEDDERAQDEPTKERVQMGGAHGHAFGYEARIVSPAPSP